MRILTRTHSILFILILLGCQPFVSHVKFDDSTLFTPTENVVLLTSYPNDKPFIKIALIEVRASDATQSIPYLLNEMKKKAASLGANAILPTEDASTETPRGILYNPWLGGYQSTGGHTINTIRGIAIKFL